jgi:hypothetical protein
MTYVCDIYPHSKIQGTKTKKRPRTCAESIQKPPTNLVFFELIFDLFFIEFSGVSQQVEFKNSTKINEKQTCQKKITKKWGKKSMSVFLIFFCVFLVVSLHGKFKNTQTIFLGNKHKKSQQSTHSPTSY